MKTTINKILLFVLLTVPAAITGCSSDSGKTKTENQTAGKAPEAAISFGSDTVKAVYDHYIHLKNVLVKSDGKEAQLAAGRLQTALNNAAGTEGAELAGQIAGTEDLKAQRAVFDALTAEVEHIVRSEPLSAGKIYKQYCPMANDGNGGYWLASEADIRNPYYGDEMLECGEVKEEIQ